MDKEIGESKYYIKKNNLQNIENLTNKKDNNKSLTENTNYKYFMQTCSSF